MRSVRSQQINAAEQSRENRRDTEGDKHAVNRLYVEIISPISPPFTGAPAINSFEDLQNQIVCCSQGTNYEMMIEDIPGTTLKTYQGQAAVGTAVAEATDNVAAGLTSINGAKKLATTMLDADGNPMLKYFALEGARADEYSMAFPKGSELVPVFNEALAQLKQSGKLDEMIHQWLY